MEPREQHAWLARRAAFGFAPGEFERAVGRGVDAHIDALVAPDANGVAAVADPFVSLTFTNEPTNRRTEALALSDRWFAHVHTTPRPLVDAMAWFWHDHFAVSFADVKAPQPFARYLSLLRTHALGSFRDLITAITKDAAMLLFLDGATSSGKAPNENYGRELLELYALGIGNYTEADVLAAARALTGWVVRPRNAYEVTFVRTRHDATPQSLLGRTVNDVTTVVDTVLRHDACALFIAGKIARWFLGPDVDPARVDEFARIFRANDLQIAPLVRAVLRAGVDGAGGELVLAPFPWLVAVQKALGVRLEVRVASQLLTSAGQPPLNPPNVGGFPGAAAWLGSSATAARVSTASALVDLLPATSPVLKSAAAGDLAGLATALGLPQGFSAATRDALSSFAASRPSGKAGAAVTVVALASPDLLVA